ncbi:TPA: hypothetical protein JAZ51_03220 [Legionella pneumophila]|uniref:hypothetical protein n=1 Tax=Legionella pneumophila TaxID=446 RepID=UPI0001D2036E|nr:hypothetical protein [Legionella pneumophila]HAT8880242.1 hypothetical protein [Legionella pneumophila subsp. pneumophila]ADG25936.1 hypothetical protein lpa_03720 [Legionella pneumophila 2300/99 Alcoy]MCW8458538.1 hypothetical protein [Legionella pneumophila]HAT7786969.1 hypothetical protein [Legionella pneumophila]HAT7792404.1 hypothetical protein [Legionella pneumophila]
MSIISNHDITFSSTQKDLIEKQQKNDIKNQHIADAKASKGGETSEKLIVFGAKTTALAACGIALLFPLTAPMIIPIAQVSGAVALVIITRKFIKSS